jgi:hypothetical protein
MRKSKRTVKALLSELEKTGIASNACSKLTIARSTYYRWYNDDIDFRMDADIAIEAGRANMVDFAESKLVQNMNEGSQRAVEFYLKHNDSRYQTYHGRELQEYKDTLEDRNRKDFKALNTIPEMLLEAIPVDTLIEIFDLNKISPDFDDDNVLDKELQKYLAMKYLASIFERAKKQI